MSQNIIYTRKRKIFSLSPKAIVRNQAYRFTNILLRRPSTRPGEPAGIENEAEEVKSLRPSHKQRQEYISTNSHADMPQKQSNCPLSHSLIN